LFFDCGEDVAMATLADDRHEALVCF